MGGRGERGRRKEIGEVGRDEMEWEGWKDTGEGENGEGETVKGEKR